MKKFIVPPLVAVACLTAAGAASAATLQLDGYTSSIQSVTVKKSPVIDSPSVTGSSGLNITNLGTGRSFLAWCLDISHSLMGAGKSQDYTQVSLPFSNSYALSAQAVTRVQAVFDANYSTLDAAVGDQAAAFQMALWEAAYEKDSKRLNVRNGGFKASSKGSTDLANSFLKKAETYTGAKLWDLSYLEVTDFGEDRASNTGQNLVTASAALRTRTFSATASAASLSVSAVPVPAGGLLLLTALLGGAVAARTRRKATVA